MSLERQADGVCALPAGSLEILGIRKHCGTRALNRAEGPAVSSHARQGVGVVSEMKWSAEGAAQLKCRAFWPSDQGP